MPRVLNKHTMTAADKGQYCGRGSKWGNRNRMMSPADRDRVCDQCEIDLYYDHSLLKALDELRGQDLICYCAPKRCHCDTLVRLANATRAQRIDWFLAMRRKLAGTA